MKKRIFLFTLACVFAFSGTACSDKNTQNATGSDAVTETNAEKITTEEITTEVEEVTTEDSEATTENAKVTTEENEDVQVGKMDSDKPSTTQAHTTTQTPVTTQAPKPSTTQAPATTQAPVTTQAQTPKPSTTQAPVTTECQHNWVAQYTHHDAVTHTAKWTEQEIVAWNDFCNGCGTDLTEAYGTVNDEACIHLTNCHASYTSKPIFRDVPKECEVEDSPAWDELTGYKCSKCGAVK